MVDGIDGGVFDWRERFSPFWLAFSVCYDVPQTEYQSIFEIGFRSFPWFTLLHPVPFIVVGALLFRFVKGRQIYQAVGILVATFATLIFLLGSVRLVPEFIADWHTYKRGDSSVVEGVVENFYPAPTLGPSKESFSVHGIIFSYYVDAASPCFSNAPAHSGPIRPGLNVRIHYKGGCIQRVDVRR